MYSLILPTLGTRIPELKRLLNSLLKQDGVEIELIVIIQDNYSEIEKVVKDYNRKMKIKLINTDIKGLSKARNLGLQHVEGNVVTFTDDDCWYPQNILREIRTRIEESQISTFQIYDLQRNELFKQYSPVKTKHQSILKSFKISSIEIFINLNRIDIKDLVFDECFGLGAKYPSGEENNLLLDLIKKKYKVNYYPKVVVYHRITEKVFNQDELYVKGAFLRRNFNLAFSFIFALAFYMKKMHLMDNKIKSLRTIISGALLYKKKRVL